MKTINTVEASGDALDWLVAKCLGIVDSSGNPKLFQWTGSGQWSVRQYPDNDSGWFYPSERYDHGSPLIEQHRISTKYLGEKLGWSATWPTWVPDEDGETIPVAGGPTALIAGLRCLVLKHFGPTAEVPEELLQ